MLQGLAQQLAARGGGQGAVPGAGTPQQGGMPAGNTGVVPPWLAQIRGGNPLGGMPPGAAQGGGGWNPLAALQARFVGMGGGQGHGGFQLPPWLHGGGQGGMGMPQGGPRGFAAPGVGQGGGQGVSAAAPAPQGGMQAWNPGSWGGGNPQAQAVAQRAMPVAGASPQFAPQQPPAAMPKDSQGEDADAQQRGKRAY